MPASYILPSHPLPKYPRNPPFPHRITEIPVLYPASNPLHTECPCDPNFPNIRNAVLSGQTHAQQTSFLRTEYPSSNSRPSRHRARLGSLRPHYSSFRDHRGAGRAAAGTAGIPSAGLVGNPSVDPDVVVGIPSVGAGRSGSNPAGRGRRTVVAESRIGVVVSRSRLGCCQHLGLG